jgi:hypothetical protein
MHAHTYIQMGCNVYKCIHTYKWVVMCTNTYKHTYIHIYIHTYTHTYIQMGLMCMCVCTHYNSFIRVHAWKDGCMHMCVHVCMCGMYTSTHACIHTHANNSNFLEFKYLIKFYHSPGMKHTRSDLSNVECSKSLPIAFDWSLPTYGPFYDHNQTYRIACAHMHAYIHP